MWGRQARLKGRRKFIYKIPMGLIATKPRTKGVTGVPPWQSRDESTARHLLLALKASGARLAFLGQRVPAKARKALKSNSHQYIQARWEEWRGVREHRAVSKPAYRTWRKKSPAFVKRVSSVSLPLDEFITVATISTRCVVRRSRAAWLSEHD